MTKVAERARALVHASSEGVYQKRMGALMNEWRVLPHQSANDPGSFRFGHCPTLVKEDL
jgi:hypothetical protein